MSAAGGAVALSQLASTPTAPVWDGALPVTVVVCTRGRPDQLRRALDSLHSQVPRVAQIVVVDNAQPNEKSGRRTVLDFLGTHYVHEPRSGLNVARNTGLHCATSPIVAFLDDDAIAERRWSERLFAAFSNPLVDACTGRVDPLSIESPGARLFEANGGFSRGRRRIELPRDAHRRLHGLPAPGIAWAISVGSGCSLAVRRHAALAVGGFDERLDNGRDIPGGGDHDMMWRLLESGGAVVYEPAAIAWHEHRKRAADALDQIAGHQRALLAFLAKSLHTAPLRKKPGIAIFLGWRLLKPSARMARRLMRRDALSIAELARMQIECIRGVATYWRLARRPKPLNRRSRARDA
jgi:GT2 family glycosyltransferase